MKHYDREQYEHAPRGAQRMQSSKEEQSSFSGPEYEVHVQLEWYKTETSYMELISYMTIWLYDSWPKHTKKRGEDLPIFFFQPEKKKLTQNECPLAL